MCVCSVFCLLCFVFCVLCSVCARAWVRARKGARGAATRMDQAPLPRPPLCKPQAADLREALGLLPGGGPARFLDVHAYAGAASMAAISNKERGGPNPIHGLTTVFRLVNSEGDGLSGLIADQLGDVVVAQARQGCHGAPGGACRGLRGPRAAGFDTGRREACLRGRLEVGGGAGGGEKNCASKLCVKCNKRK